MCKGAHYIGNIVGAKLAGKVLIIDDVITAGTAIREVMGLIDEAEKYAKLLGYNYQSSRWYEQSYSLFDKTYEIRNREIKKEKDNKLLKRFKSIFN